MQRLSQRPVSAIEWLFDPSAIDVVRDIVPERFYPLFRWATHLGDGAVLVAVGVFCWLAEERTRGATVLSFGLGGLALAAGLKALFARPRPESPAFVTEVGYSFPSAHALGATVLWLAAAELLTVCSRRLRYGVAFAIVAVVALSRVVLGVHYPGDVIGGVLVGLLYLAIGFRLVGPDSDRLFALAVTLAFAGGLIRSAPRTTIATLLDDVVPLDAPRNAI